jgi:RNA-directed DNA polymerase
VGSIKAGQRVMAMLRTLYSGLKLEVNEAMSAVGIVFGRKFLGYALWVAKGREMRYTVAPKAVEDLKARIRQLPRRSGMCSMEQVVQRLRPYLLGWKASFGRAQTSKFWRTLDELLRHHLRAIQLQQWKRPRTTYQTLKAFGAGETVANAWRPTTAAGGPKASSFSRQC